MLPDASLGSWFMGRPHCLEEACVSVGVSTCPPSVCPCDQVSVCLCGCECVCLPCTPVGVRGGAGSSSPPTCLSPRQEQKFCQRYDQLMEAWEKKVERIENNPRRRAKESKVREYYEKQFPEIRKQRELQERMQR